jgi:hypothetical protein
MALCLAKDPADRYANGDDLARDLYPLARRTAKAVRRPDPRPWLSRRLPRLSARQVWTVAALSIAAVLVSRLLGERFRVPPAPPSAAVAFAPRAPEILLTTLTQTQMEEPVVAPSPEPAESSRTAKEKSKSSRRAAPKMKSASPVSDTARVAANRTQLGVSRDTSTASVAENKAAEPRRGELQIEILTQTADGTLAIYADRELLFTQILRAADDKKPVRFQRELPLGPHQLRVALYRPDKSLQTEKEGLGEIRADGNNKLAIRVARRPKFLLKHATLEVIWPAAAPAAAAESAPAEANLPRLVAATASQLRH